MSALPARGREAEVRRLRTDDRPAALPSSTKPARFPSDGRLAGTPSTQPHTHRTTHTHTTCSCALWCRTPAAKEVTRWRPRAARGKRQWRRRLYRPSASVRLVPPPPAHWHCHFYCDNMWLPHIHIYAVDAEYFADLVVVPLQRWRGRWRSSARSSTSILRAGPTGAPSRPSWPTSPHERWYRSLTSLLMAMPIVPTAQPTNQPLTLAVRRGGGDASCRCCSTVPPSRWST